MRKICSSGAADPLDIVAESELEHDRGTSMAQEEENEGTGYVSDDSVNEHLSFLHKIDCIESLKLDLRGRSK